MLVLLKVMANFIVIILPKVTCYISTWFALVFNEDTSDSFSKLPDSPYPDISKTSVTRKGAINLLHNLKEF